MSILIAIEGLDGSGKSTLAKGLASELSNHPEFYPWVYLSKEPGSMWTGVGPEIRRMVLETPDFKPFERELLFYVDASLHARFINNQKNAIIVSDRGKWSHLAYIRGYLKSKQMNYEEYSLGKKIIDQVCMEPDCVVYLDADLGLMQERLAGKEKDAIERNGEEFFSAVLDTYKDLVRDWEWEGRRILTLSASDSTDKNIMKVVEYLKEVFDHGQLKTGDREICQ